MKDFRKKIILFDNHRFSNNVIDWKVIGEHCKMFFGISDHEKADWIPGVQDLAV